jgi:soluble lytic murein transglycosylase
MRLRRSPAVSAALPLGILLIALPGSQAIAGGDPEVEALSRAMQAIQHGRLKEALAAIQAPASSSDILQDYRAWIRARILYGLSQSERARSALEGIAREPPSTALCKPGCRHPLSVDVAELNARTYESRSPKTAADLLAGLAPDGRLWTRAANLYRSAHDETSANEIEERILVETAESPEAHELASQLGRPGLARWVTSLDRRRARLFRLLDTHDNEGARSEADDLLGELPKKHPLGCDLLYVSGKASRKLHEYARAIDALTRARKECARVAGEANPPAKSKTSSTAWAIARRTAEELQLRSMLLETEVRAIRGDLRGARKVALAIADAHRQHSFADDALFFLAELLEGQGQTEEALTLYQRILDEHAEEDLAPEAMWRIAFSAIRSKDVVRAREILTRIAGGPAGHGIDGARARYWIARSMEDDSDQTCRAYRDAALDPALTFYAWLAMDRIMRVAPSCGARLREELALLRDRAARSSTVASAPKAELSRRIHSSPEFARARKLVEITGFKVYGSLEIGLLKHEGMTQQEVVALALAYDEIGDHRQAQLLLRSRAPAALASFPDGEVFDVWRAAYSRPYEEEIEHAAREQKIEPWLLYALAREESTFDPAVISWAGAVGLAQLMPRTARSIFARLRIGRFDASKLTDPAVSARLGAYLLRDNLRAFKSSVPLALVAYNGGIALASKNLPPAEQDFDVWVETIPVKETRRYVKRVIQSYGVYRFLYERDHPFIELPERIRSRRGG